VKKIAEKTRKFFEGYADQFDENYTIQNQKGFRGWLNRHLRASILIRYEKTFSRLQPMKNRTVIDIGCGSRRYLLIILLLLVGVVLTWGQRLTTATVLPAELTIPAGDDQNPIAAVPAYVYFLDVAGWYRITPYETVVRSPYDLTADTTEALADLLPTTVGEWQKVGQDEDIAEDPVVAEFLGDPKIALQRNYRDLSGQSLSLVIIGNKGNDSFLLFSHTPEICYPSSLWQIMENRRDMVFLDDQRMYAQYLFAEHNQTGRRMATLYWYLWDNPHRDSKDGVLSMRVNLFLFPGQSEEAALASAWSFVRQLFPAIVAWERF